MTGPHLPQAFDFGDEAALADYIETRIGTLQATSRELYTLIKRTRHRLDGTPYHQLIDLACEPALFEAADATGPTLRKFYGEVFGVRFQRPAIAKEKLRRRAIVDEPIEVRETDFERHLSAVIEQTETILQRWSDQSHDTPSGNVTDADWEEFISQPNTAINKVRTYLSLAQQVLPNYNPWAFFVWSLQGAQSTFASQIYPNLFESAASEVLAPLGTVSKTVSVEASEDLIFTGYRSDSVGQALVDLYVYIWDSFDGGDMATTAGYFEGLPNYREQFIENCVEALHESQYDLPDKCKPLYKQREGDAEFRRTLWLADPHEKAQPDESTLHEEVESRIARLAPVCFLLQNLTVCLTVSGNEPEVVSL